MRCWHTHTAPGKDYRVMQYTHCSLAHLQSSLRCGTVSGLLARTLSYGLCYVLKLRGSGVAKNYGMHAQKGNHQEKKIAVHADI